MSGSVLPRAFVFGALAGVYAGLFEGYLSDLAGEMFVHPYPYHSIALITGFGLIFRLNLSMQRYWEARSMVQNMASKWLDGAIQVLAFDEAGLGEAIPENMTIEAWEAKLRSAAAFRTLALHLFSLLHGLAMQTLRTHRLRMDTGRREECARWETSHEVVDLHEFAASMPAIALETLVMARGVELVAPPLLEPCAPRKRANVSVGSMAESQTTARTMHTAARMPVRRSPVLEETFRPLRRGSFSNRATYELCDAEPLPVLGGLTVLEHGELRCAREPVALVMGWLIRALSTRRKAGGLNLDGPIVSRIFQVLSDGMLGKIANTPFPHLWRPHFSHTCQKSDSFVQGTRVQHPFSPSVATPFLPHVRNRILFYFFTFTFTGYSGAIKVRDTPFPFPYAQLNTGFCVINMAILPILIASYVDSVPMAAAIATCAITMLFAVNEVARELEDPLYGNYVPYMVTTPPLIW